VLLGKWREQAGTLAQKRDAALQELHACLAAEAAALDGAGPAAAAAAAKAAPAAPAGGAGGVQQDGAPLLKGTLEAKRLLGVIEGVQVSMIATDTLFTMTIYGCLVRAEQCAAFCVAAHPYIPSLPALDQALRRLAADRAAAAEAAAAAPAAAAAAEAGGRGRARGRAPRQPKGG
jgi:hypothetical protein